MPLLNLQSVGVNLKLLNVLDWRHVLLVMLLVFLLLAQLAQLEHLEPALIAEHFCAELDHLTVNGVVGWNVIDQARVLRLNIRNH